MGAQTRQRDVPKLDRINIWGLTDSRFGYGALVTGLREHLPITAVLDMQTSISVYCGPPDTCPGFIEGSHKAIFTMWESDVLPEKWVRYLGEYDQVIVPCEHNLRLFGQHHRNVVRVPLGVDQTVWFPVEREPNRRFRFACGGSLWRRKGLDLVVDAFMALDLDAELHIKAAPHMADLPKVFADPRIRFHQGWMGEPELVDWVRQADCWVAPSRGEGFGLIGLQAIACGVPTVLSDTSGHREYKILASEVVPTVPIPAPLGGMWDEPDFDGLVVAMRRVWEDADRRRSGALARVGMVEAFSWDRASERLLEALPEGVRLPDGRLVPLSPLVTVEVNRAVSPDVAGKRYTLDPGGEYRVPDEVARILSEAGFLV